MPSKRAALPGQYQAQLTVWRQPAHAVACVLSSRCSSVYNEATCQPFQRCVSPSQCPAALNELAAHGCQAISPFQSCAPPISGVQFRVEPAAYWYVLVCVVLQVACVEVWLLSLPTEEDLILVGNPHGIGLELPSLPGTKTSDSLYSGSTRPGAPGGHGAAGKGSVLDSAAEQRAMMALAGMTMYSDDVRHARPEEEM